ncbi:uncharacterized protein [Dermacentor andersoni]|uniref:uncharacterized protein isoform X1 n=1 Tax=Dermacentor andersoni TaxID=34620 RepID=UPI003B3BC603
MYAFGRFRDDGMKVAVSVDRIKNFAPKNLRDFNSTKWYGLRWEDEENSGYFRAQIMKLFATKEEADACTEGVEKRISCPKMPLYSDSEEDSCTSHDSYREEKKNKRTSKLRQKNVEATFRKKQLEALFPEEQDHKTEELEQEVSRLRAENAKLSARIEMLERALCSKIFDSEKRCCEKSAHGDKVLTSSESSMKKALQPSGSAGAAKPAQQLFRSPEGPVKGSSEETPSSNLKENDEPNAGKLTAPLYKSAEGQVSISIFTHTSLIG